WRDAGHTRAGPLCRDSHPPLAAGTARPAGAQMAPPPPAAGRDRRQARKAPRLPLAGRPARIGRGWNKAGRGLAKRRAAFWCYTFRKPTSGAMNWFLVIVIVLLAVMVVVSLVRGIVAFLQTTKIDL